PLFTPGADDCSVLVLISTVLEGNIFAFAILYDSGGIIFKVSKVLYCRFTHSFEAVTHNIFEALRCAPFVKQRYIIGIEHPAVGHYYYTLDVVLGFEFIYGLFKSMAFIEGASEDLKSNGYLVFVDE